MILFQLILLIILIYVIYILSYSMLRGAPFAALSNNRIETMMKLLQIKKGERLVDLGSGDGRIIIEAAKMGAVAYGFEINPVIYLISIVKIKTGNSKARVELSDYWKRDLSEFNSITVWGVKGMMTRLERKLQKELKRGTKIVSNHQKFPNWKYEKKIDDVYLYIKK